MVEGRTQKAVLLTVVLVNGCEEGWSGLWFRLLNLFLLLILLFLVFKLILCLLLGVEPRAATLNSERPANSNTQRRQ